MKTPLAVAALLGLAREGLGLPAEPLPNPPPDWSPIIELARRNGLAPLLEAGLRRRNLPAPPQLLQALRKHRLAAELWHERAGEQLEEALFALNERGLEPILLKGARLATAYYPSPGLRPYGDLDLLVSPRERCCAAEALVELGYAGDFDRPGRGRQYWLTYHHHWGFAHPKRLRIDLHWTLTPPNSSVQFDLEQLRARGRRLPEWRGRVVGLARQDELAYLAAHLTKHQFRLPLRHFLDLAAISEGESGLDWPAAWRSAAAAGAEADLSAALEVAAELGVVRLPEAALAGRARTLSANECRSLARYAREWTDFEPPARLLNVGSADTAGGAVRALLSPAISRLSTREGGAHGDEAAGPWDHLRRWLRRAPCLIRQIGPLRAAVAIQRRFGNREDLMPPANPEPQPK